MTKDSRRHNNNGNVGQDENRNVPEQPEAERALLGAAMLSRAAHETLVTKTRPEDFYVPFHSKIAAIAHRALAEGWNLDPVTVLGALDFEGEERQRAGADLISMQAHCPATTNADRYATQIHDAATLRRLIHTSQRIGELGFDGADAHEAVTQAQSLLSDVAANNGSRKYSNTVFADVGRIVAGDLPRVDTDFLTRSDGLRLFYAGKMHSLQAEPSTGKSWVALLACLEVLEIGGAAMYLDYEDSGEGIVGRLMGLGADPAAVTERFCYVQLQGPYGAAERLEIEAKFGSLNPDLVVIDGVAEALTRDGFSEDKATEVVQWIEKVPRAFARTGAAVVMLDHVGKDKETRGRWARGSGAKLAAIDGAAYEIKIITGFSRHKAGSMRITIAKDRPGAVGEVGSVAAVCHFEPAGDGIVVKMRLETPPTESAERFKPTGMMERCSLLVERSTQNKVDLTMSVLRNSMGGKSRVVNQAIEELTMLGYIRVARIRNGNYVKLIKPYREGAPAIPLQEPPLFNAPPAEDESTIIQGPWKPQN